MHISLQVAPALLQARHFGWEMMPLRRLGELRSTLKVSH
jgi:hypothetical protein